MDIPLVDYSNAGKPLSEVNPNLKNLESFVSIEVSDDIKPSHHMEQRCYYCNSVLLGRRKTIDHIIPISRYGKNDKVNLVNACVSCNGMKSNLSLEEFIEIVKLKVVSRRRKNHIISQIKLLINFRDANANSMVGDTLIIRRKNNKSKNRENS